MIPPELEKYQNQSICPLCEYCKEIMSKKDDIFRNNVRRFLNSASKVGLAIGGGFLAAAIYKELTKEVYICPNCQVRFNEKNAKQCPRCHIRLKWQL